MGGIVHSDSPPMFSLLFRVHCEILIPAIRRHRGAIGSSWRAILDDPGGGGCPILFNHRSLHKTAVFPVLLMARRTPGKTGQACPRFLLLALPSKTTTKRVTGSRAFMGGFYPSSLPSDGCHHRLDSGGRMDRGDD